MHNHYRNHRKGLISKRSLVGRKSLIAQTTGGKSENWMIVSLIRRRVYLLNRTKRSIHCHLRIITLAYCNIIPTSLQKVSLYKTKDGCLNLLLKTVHAFIFKYNIHYLNITRPSMNCRFRSKNNVTFFELFHALVSWKKRTALELHWQLAL